MTPDPNTNRHVVAVFVSWYDNGHLDSIRCNGCGFWWHTGDRPYQEFIAAHSGHQAP